MADEGKARKAKRLPPISETARINENGIRPQKRKTKKRALDTEVSKEDTSVDPSTNHEDKPTSRPRKNVSASQEITENKESQNTPTKSALPRKKKKKASAFSEQNAGGRPSAEIKDGQGSKTSLISKDGGTPQKRPGKKKKTTKKATVNVDEYGDSPWADDLRTMKEDIITRDGQDDEEGDGDNTRTGQKKTVTSYISAPVLRSQPLDKIFIETSSKFKGQGKASSVKPRVTDTTRSPEQQQQRRTTTIEFALSTHKIFHTITLFLHGLTAGLSLWQMVVVFSLSTFSSDDFLEHYHTIAMPLQSSYYFLLVICTVSACDRFDIGNPTRHFVLRALTMQNGAISIVFCLVALVLSLVAIRYDDKMNLHKDDAALYPSDSIKTEEINTYKGINAARSVFIILSWLVLSITPNSDRLGRSLKSGQTGLETNVAMDRGLVTDLPMDRVSLA